MPTVKTTTYQFRPGSPFPKQAAPAVGRELHRIRKRHEGNLEPKHVVEAAASTTSPLHRFFEWDNGAAANQYRLAQARRLIGAIEVVVIVNRKEIPVREFHNVVITNKEENSKPVRAYVPLNRIEEDKVLRDQVTADVIHDAEYFLRKYRGILESCGVATDFERVIETLKKHAA